MLEEAVNEIQEAECQATGYLNQMSSYFSSRAKVGLCDLLPAFHLLFKIPALWGLP